MEHIGTGIRRMNDAMIDNGLMEPILEESGEFFKVTFYGKDFINKRIKLNNRQTSFLENDISRITVSEYMELFDITRNTARSDLNYLVDENLFKKFKVEKSFVYKKIE